MRNTLRRGSIGSLAWGVLLCLASGTLAADCVPWEPTIDAARRVAAETDRLVLIHFWATSCGPCRNVERAVFSQSTFADRLSASYVPVKVDMDATPELGEHFNVKVWPTDVLMTPAGKVVAMVRCPPDANAYLARLDKVAAVERQAALAGPVQLVQYPQQAPASLAPGGPNGAYSPPYGVTPGQPWNAAPPAYGGPLASRTPLAGPGAPGSAGTGSGVMGTGPARYAPPQGANQYLPPSAAGFPAPTQQPNMALGQSSYYAGPAQSPAAAPVANRPMSNGPMSNGPMSNGPMSNGPMSNGPMSNGPTSNGPMASGVAGGGSPAAGNASTVVARASNPPASRPSADSSSTRTIPGSVIQPAEGGLVAALFERRQANAAAVNKQPSAAEAAATTTKPGAPGVNPIQLPYGSPPLGLDGYCPVTLEAGRWEMGDRRWGAIHHGRTYLFKGPEEQRRFLEAPDRYAPMLQGNDPVLAMDQHQETPGLRSIGARTKGTRRLYLFSSKATYEQFGRSASHYEALIEQAVAKNPLLR